MTRQTRFVTFESYVPEGPIEASHFVIRSKVLPELTDGQVLLRPIVFSIDPAQRGMITGGSAYFLPQYPVGSAMRGPAVAEVVESRHPDQVKGSLVSGWFDWADYLIWPFPNDWLGLSPVDSRLGKPSYAVGVFGLTGLTAYFGMVEVGEVRAGDIVLVSSAAGAVGSIAGQIAKILGARVIGLTGSQPKCEILTQKLRFDLAINYRSSDFAKRLEEAMPKGPDVYFDNVGGQLSQTVMNLMRRPARVVECGQISTYDDADGAWMVDIKPIHRNGLRFEGFTSVLFSQQWPTAISKMAGWVTAGQLLPLETEYKGLKSLPKVLEGLFRGENTGKVVVTVD
jgi:NADPH-dependent curcumin reductase CurA